MTIKIEDKISRPLLGGARIADSGPKQFDRPHRDEDMIIGNHTNLKEFEKASLEKKADLEANIKPQSSVVAPTVKVELLRNTGGFTGLTNLGNTCFMSCILQALANIRELRDYFLTERFRNDVNSTNPLGTKGTLVEKFYITLKHLWSRSSGTYPPYELKAVVSKHAPQFIGYMQHDAQEFLAFFLDLLHEDVNRIIEKPLFETPNLDSCPDEVVAAELWKLHKSRNDSFIVDLFHGMLKSKLTCPQCHRHSTTFDPFVFLPVPIPQGKMRLGVTYCGIRTGPSSFELLVSGNETALHLLSVASRKFAVPLNSLKLFNITSSYSGEELSKSTSLSFCKYANLIVLETDHMSGDCDTKEKTIVILQREKSKNVCANCGKTPNNDVRIMRCTNCKQVGYCGRDCQGADWQKHKSNCNEKIVGLPFIMQVKCTPSKLEFYNELTRWLGFLMSVNCHNSNQVDNSSLDMSSLDKCEAFTMYRYSNSKEMLIANKDELDLRTATRIIIEWAVNVVPKVKKSCAASGPNISDCLRLFTEPEVLAAEEAWHCPHCKENRKATKELSLWKLPKVVIIQFKRFSLQNRLWRQKVDDLVEFPIKGLDLRPFCGNDQDIDPIYDLFAVANHHGGLHGGHYTSYVTLGEGSVPGWRHCDDSNVTPVRSLDQLVTKSSYVLFYRRRFDPSLTQETDFSHQDYQNTTDNVVPNGISKNEIINKTADAMSPVLPKASIVIPAHETNAGDKACCSNHEDRLLPVQEDFEFSYTDMDAVD